MNRKNWYQLHRLGWSIYLGYELIGDWLLSPYPLRSSLLSSTQVALRLLEFYCCYWLVFPQLLRSEPLLIRLVKLLSALLGIMALYMGLRYGLEQGLYPRLFGFGNYNPNTTLSYYVSDNLYFASPAIAVSWLTWTIERTIQREEETQQLRHQMRTAEEAFLRAQIAPHFLFNTLNYLYVLAYPVSKPLASAILKLSELMRYTLAASSASQVVLRQEVAYLQDYLDLYRLRFPGRFFVNFIVEGELRDQQVAALLLIPFVENAIKHGVIDQARYPVQITLTIRRDDLVLSVDNTIGNQQKETTSGIGITNVRRRLELLYPGRYELVINQTPAQFNTYLLVPIH
ncbi:sensor histidine kinase [Fibrella forsythiae]|uniref:Histidine kinase n=1 Tax=Fibrella forsythiae TaxID=2817061 RepID=A0ABS3JKQ6_9BACT|nr:histidine kinase [Fibrella forsythiae]MBO0950577.1 histidine kinase [Fibrella forsythiae]